MTETKIRKTATSILLLVVGSVLFWVGVYYGLQREERRQSISDWNCGYCNVCGKPWELVSESATHQTYDCPNCRTITIISDKKRGETK